MASENSSNNNMEVLVKFDSTPPQVFISRMRKFILENKPPAFNIKLKWEEQTLVAAPPSKRRKHGTGSVPPTGYDSAEFPQVGGSSPCPYCYCTPCVISLPPNFLEGSSAPHIRNQSKRFTLYKHFWGLLKDVGVWRHPPYLERKERRTSIDDAREVMPKCVVEEIRKRYPNPEGIPYTDYVSTFEASLDE